MKTACFFTFTGPGRISIARYAPRGTPAGFRVYKALAPGSWFNSVSEAEYRRLFSAQLARLDVHQVYDELHRLAEPAEPVLLCWERQHDIARGHTYCHRHMVAEWFLTELGCRVDEL